MCMRSNPLVVSLDSSILGISCGENDPSVTLPGVQTKELEPWYEQGEKWRRLKVTSPSSIATHSAEQLTAIENETVLVKHFQALHAVNTMQLERYVKRDFSDVFEKYIKA